MASVSATETVRRRTVRDDVKGKRIVSLLWKDGAMRSDTSWED